MAPEEPGAGNQSPVSGTGPQEITKSRGAQLSCSPTTNIIPAEQDHSPGDRRTSTTGLSDAVRDCRRRSALDDIWRALAPVTRDTESAMLCIENDDDYGLQYHLGRVIVGARKAGAKHKELRALLAAPAREKAQ